MQAPTTYSEEKPEKTTFPLCDPTFLEWMYDESVCIEGVYPVGCVTLGDGIPDGPEQALDLCDLKELREIFGEQRVPEDIDDYYSDREMMDYLWGALQEQRETGLLISVSMCERSYYPLDEDRDDDESCTIHGGIRLTKLFYAPTVADIEQPIRDWVEQMVKIMKSKRNKSKR